MLPPDLVEGAVRHMNEDHAENLLDYARVLLGLDWAESAELLSLDAAGLDLRVHGPDRRQVARLDFDAPLTGPEQLREALVELARRARAGL